MLSSKSLRCLKFTSSVFLSCFLPSYLLSSFLFYPFWSFMFSVFLSVHLWYGLHQFCVQLHEVGVLSELCKLHQTNNVTSSYVCCSRHWPMCWFSYYALSKTSHVNSLGSHCCPWREQRSVARKFPHQVTLWIIYFPTYINKFTHEETYTVLTLN